VKNRKMVAIDGKKVYSVVNPQNDGTLKAESHRKTPDRLSKEEAQIVESYKTKMLKIAYNTFPNFKHDGYRCKELNKWRQLFVTGWPWKNNDRLRHIATPIMVNYTEMLEKRLRDLFKSKFGKDIGRVEY